MRIDSKFVSNFIAKLSRMKKFLLTLSVLLSALHFQSIAQLVAEAGADTVVCNSASYPRLGGAPSAYGGTPPYTYTWTYTPDPINTFFYLDNINAANPKMISVSLSGDTMNFELLVSDAIGNIATDLVRVKVARWTCSGGACVKNIVEGDTVALGTGCFGNYAPNTILWSPAINLSSPTSSNPATWTKTTTSYYAKTTNNIGCWRNDTCKVNVTPLGVNGLGMTSGHVMVYPNPVNEHSVFEVSNDMLGGVLKVYTVDGKLLSTKAIMQAKTEIGTVLQGKSAIYIYSYEKQGSRTIYGKLVSM